MSDEKGIDTGTEIETNIGIEIEMGIVRKARSRRISTIKHTLRSMLMPTAALA